jgi:hypothetical protein
MGVFFESAKNCTQTDRGEAVIIWGGGGRIPLFMAFSSPIRSDKPPKHKNGCAKTVLRRGRFFGTIVKRAIGMNLGVIFSHVKRKKLYNLFGLTEGIGYRTS